MSLVKRRTAKEILEELVKSEKALSSDSYNIRARAHYWIFKALAKKFLEGLSYEDFDDLASYIGYIFCRKGENYDQFISDVIQWLYCRSKEGVTIW